MSIYPKGDKFNDADLAAKLWPVYLKHGTVEAVHDHCLQEEIRISKPTLHKMVKHFGWEKKRSEASKASFAGAIDQSGELETILADLTKLKNDVHNSLSSSPNDVKLHGIYGNYIGQILAIRKSMMDEKKVDRDRLLIDVLKAVVNHLVAQGLSDAANDISNNLEYLADKVKESWQ